MLQNKRIPSFHFPFVHSSSPDILDITTSGKYTKTVDITLKTCRGWQRREVHTRYTDTEYTFVLV